MPISTVQPTIIGQKTLCLFPDRLRKVLNLHVRIPIAGQAVIVPVTGDESFKYLDWVRSWKATLFERLARPDRGAFLDVGANIGQTLLDLHLVQPETLYFGFEPNPACLNYLHDLININSLQHHVILPVGLAEEAKIAPLYAYDNRITDQDATLLPDLRGGLQTLLCFVPCFPLDAIREDIGIQSIGFVKIDVEGAELEVITGMRNSLALWRPVVLCEVLFSFPTPSHLASVKDRIHHLMQLLREMRYQVRQIHKSPNHSRINEAVKIQEFPSAYWTEENRHLCDYLFIPIEDEMRVLHELGISK